MLVITYPSFFVGINVGKTVGEGLLVGLDGLRVGTFDGLLLGAREDGFEVGAQLQTHPGT
jgi:hypothetical protein